MHYNGHEQEVRLLLPLGDQLISADSSGDVIVWDVQSGGESEVVWLALHSPAVAYMCSYPSCLTLSASQRCTCGCTLTHQPLTYQPWCTRAPTWTRCSWGAPRVHCSSGTSRPGEGVALDSEHWQKHIQKSPETLSDFRFPSMSLWWSLCKTCKLHTNTNDTTMTQLPSACSKEPQLSQLVGLSLLQKYLLLQHAVKNKLF